MLTLWYSPTSVSLASHIALEEAGADFELVKVDFGSAEQQSPSYKAVNPKGRVPTLETPHGYLSETIAILGWIAQAYPSAALEPADPFQRAQALALQSYLASTVHVNHAHKMRGARWADDAAAWESMRQKVPQTMTESMALLEQHMFVGPFAMGDQFTTTDAYLFTVCRWLEGDQVDMTAVPRLAAYFDMLKARPSVARAFAHYD